MYFATQNRVVVFCSWQENIGLEVVEMTDKESIGKLAQWRVTKRGKAYSMVSDCFEIRIWTW